MSAHPLCHIDGPCPQRGTLIVGPHTPTDGSCQHDLGCTGCEVTGTSSTNLALGPCTIQETPRGLFDEVNT